MREIKLENGVTLRLFEATELKKIDPNKLVLEDGYDVDDISMLYDYLDKFIDTRSIMLSDPECFYYRDGGGNIDSDDRNESLEAMIDSYDNLRSEKVINVIEFKVQL